MYRKTEFLLYKYINFFIYFFFHAWKNSKNLKNDLSKVPPHANSKSKKGPSKNFWTSIFIRKSVKKIRYKHHYKTIISFASVRI
jgi:hypothetical protein